MPLETVTVPVTPDQLNPDWPLPDDPRNEGDDHIRNIKASQKEFWRKVNFVGLSNGAVPVYQNGKLVDAGFQFNNGQATLLRPFVAPMFIQAGGLNPKKYQLLGSELADAAVKRPDAPTAAALVDTAIQPVDSSLNAAPIAFAFIQDVNAWVKGVVVRSTGNVPHVRITLRDTSALGAILYQTASDAELIAGGGASLVSGGDSNIFFPQKLEVFSGNAIFVQIDRYDPSTQTIVNTGITLKGTTISGQFIPYYRSMRQLIVRKPVLVSTDQPIKSYQQSGGDVALSTVAAVVGTFNFTHNLTTTSFGVEVGCHVTGIPNGTLILNVYVNNVLVDSGSGLTARQENTVTPRTFVIWAVLAGINLPAGSTNVIRVEALLSTGTATKKATCLSILSPDTGDVWA